MITEVCCPFAANLGSLRPTAGVSKGAVGNPRLLVCDPFVANQLP